MNRALLIAEILRAMLTLTPAERPVPSRFNDENTVEIQRIVSS